MGRLLLSLGLVAGPVQAQITVNAGPDLIVTFPQSLTLQGRITGRTPLEFWTADGNGVNENKLIKFHETKGITAVGPIKTTGGTVYGWVNDILEVDGVVWGVAPLSRQMFILNSDTGVATLVGEPMDSPFISGLAHEEATSTTYGIDDKTRDVVNIDLATGLSTVIVKSVPYGRPRCLAFEPSSGLLYGFGEDSPWIFTVDPQSGKTANVVRLQRTRDEIYDDFQFYEGELYAM